MTKVQVLMKANARPRACAKLLAGETYKVPEQMASRLVAIGKAEVVAEEATSTTRKRKPKKASQAEQQGTQPPPPDTH